MKLLDLPSGKHCLRGLKYRERDRNHAMKYNSGNSTLPFAEVASEGRPAIGMRQQYDEIGRYAVSRRRERL